MKLKFFLRQVWHLLPLKPGTRYRFAIFLRRWLPWASFAQVTRPTPPPLPPELDVQQRSAPRQGTPFGSRVVLVFGVISWDFRIQRPQQLARCLAANNGTVFYVEPCFFDHDKPGYTLRAVPDEDQIWLLQLSLKGNPAIYFDLPSAPALQQLQLGMAAFMMDWRIEASTAIIDHVFWSDLVFTLPNCVRVYDCMDHHAGFGGVSQALIEKEESLTQRCDRILVTSDWLAHWVKKLGVTASVVRNGCDYAYFSKQPTAVYSSPSGKKVIGYVGAIAEWFDLELMEKIAIHFGDCHILLIGADTINASTRLKKYKNVQLLGEKPYQELTYYLYGFDVCLLPFVRNELTLATNPVKVYEYLSTGKPVVCIDLPEVNQFGNLVHKALHHDDFVQHIDFCLKEYLSDASVSRRLDFASQQTWLHRAAEVENSLGQISWPKISVVVLTYNNWDLTDRCLESVLKVSDYPGDIELIVVDNASQDETASRLTDWTARESRMKVILNSENLGFAAGNNVGIQSASGDFVVLLNNDTVVTRGWLLGLLRHFQADGQLGILGPVTNNIGNEAKVNVTYETLELMPDAARRYTSMHMGKLFSIKTVAFFCVMLPKRVMDAVGLLDERFGRGFFEDDDYCRRIEQLGYRIACAEDVFVHHHLSASFDKLKFDERQRLFEENKCYYESKWGRWEPHVYRE